MHIGKTVKSVWLQLKRIAAYLAAERPEGNDFYINGPETLPAPLSPEEEAQVIAQMMEDRSMCKVLIEHNLRLVAHIIKKYYANYKDQDDLISIGTIGLIKAVSTFDYTKGTRFATYAARCIEKAILPIPRILFFVY